MRLNFVTLTKKVDLISFWQVKAHKQNGVKRYRLEIQYELNCFRLQRY